MAIRIAKVYNLSFSMLYLKAGWISVDNSIVYYLFLANCPNLVMLKNEKLLRNFLFKKYVEVCFLWRCMHALFIDSCMFGCNRRNQETGMN